VRALLDEIHPALVGLSRWIHANPEIGNEERLASGWVTEWLRAAGFDTRGAVGGLETAVAGSIGPGPLHVAICAEYDALPEVGHACGHNVICAAGVGAGIALATVADALGLRVTVVGTPAEEAGGGKIGLIEHGFFDDVHASMMVHPWPSDVERPQLIAVRQLTVRYHGREAHAAAFPYLGVNAADALVVAQTAIGLLRQQLLPSDRVHGFVTKGGDAANVIPAETSAAFMVRATTRERMEEVGRLVRRCFEAGAVATGAELELVEEVAYSDMRHDEELARLYRRNAESLGRTFDDGPSMPVSTDMGDVSRVVPSIHPMIGIEAGGSVNHQPAFAAACATPSADKAIFDGALAMALTVIDAAEDPAIRARLLSTTGAASRPRPRGQARPGW
jgi:amidohydrolase